MRRPHRRRLQPEEPDAETVDQASIPSSAQSWSRRRNFWIFVADIGHSVTKRTWRGILKLEIVPLQNAISSSSLVVGARRELDEGGRHLGHRGVRDRDDLRELHGRMGAEEVLDLERGDVLAADLEHVLRAPDVGDASRRRPGGRCRPCGTSRRATPRPSSPDPCSSSPSTPSRAGRSRPPRRPGGPRRSRGRRPSPACSGGAARRW